MSIPGYAQNAVCPKCETYTQQYIVVRGIRHCLNCGEQFKLKDTERIVRGKVVKPAQQKVQEAK